MGNLLKLLALSAFVILLINACSKPSTLGGGLLELDQEDVEFTDTIQIVTTTVRRDSVIAFDIAGNGTPRVVTVGNYEDPIFGTVKSDSYIQISPDNSGNVPSSVGLKVDSVFLTLSIDSFMTKGDFSTNLQFEILEVMDSFDLAEVVYSHQNFATFPEVLGTFDGKPSLIDETVVYDENGDTLINDFLIKIPLDTVLGRKLIDSTNNLNFDEAFAGMYLKTLNNSPTESILAIAVENRATRLIVYYSNEVDNVVEENGQYPFVVSALDFRSSTLENDISGTILEEYLNGTNTNEDQVFMQGLGGPDIEVDLSDITNLGSVLINSAIIEFTAKKLDGGSSSTFPAAKDLIFKRLDDDDQFVDIDDSFLGQEVFGGEFDEMVIVADAVLGTYSLDISDYMQKIVDGDEEPILYLRTFPKISNTDRVVLFGQESIDYKPKLELTFTRINQ